MPRQLKADQTFDVAISLCGAQDFSEGRPQAVMVAESAKDILVSAWLSAPRNHSWRSPKALIMSSSSFRWRPTFSRLNLFAPLLQCLPLVQPIAATLRGRPAL